MRHYSNDKPIEGTIESPDFLNREEFARHLAKILILSPEDDCLTVSLEGEWGYGKTSVINLVKKYCRYAEAKPIIVEYNPWLGGKAEALIQDFLVQLSAQLSIPDRPKEALKAAKEILSYSKLFSVMKFIPGAEPWASTVEQVFGLMGNAANKLGKLKKLDLLGGKEKVQRALISLRVPIVVIIDDIDRLPPDDAFQVIRLVKAVADFSGTSFLLAFDAEYLTEALKKQGIAKADQYVDKVVQLRVSLPLIAYTDMHKLAEAELESLAERSLTGYFEEDQERLSLLYHQYVKYLVRSPRELKRIFNHLRFVLAQTEGKVCFSDIYGLSVLAIKASSVYQHIKDAPLAYIGRNFDEQLETEKSEEIVKRYTEHREAKVNICREKDRNFVWGIIKELFPLVEGEDYGHSESTYDSLGRVAASKRLHIALHYQVPTGHAADTDIVAFLEGNKDRISYLRKSIDEEFVERFFELVSQNVDKVPESDILPVLEALYEVYLPSEYLKRQEESKVGFIGFELARGLRWLTFDLIDRATDKEFLIRKLIEKEKYVFITASVIRRLMVQFGEEKTIEPREQKGKWLSEDSYKEVKTIWADIAIRGVMEGWVLHSALANQVFFALKRVDQQRTKELMTQLLAGERPAEKIAKLIGRSGTDSINGPYVQIEKEDFQELLDFEVLVTAAKHELEREGDLPPELKAVYLSIATGEKYYLKDATMGEKF
ncbi:MAG TPA: P-loop NTPase fold protein [Gammaproteobacteria bacterium]